MLEAVIQGIVNVFSPSILFWIFVGVIVGSVVGILPGLGGVATLAILLPLIYGKDPVLALAFLIALHSVVYTSSTITSVLFGIPGETASTATILDGYPMAKQGKAGRAMAGGLMASLVGGIFGAVVLAAFIPVAKPIVLAFGSPELFMMAVLGLSYVAVLGRGSMSRALIAGMLGLLMAFVGFHTGTGALRYTFGNLYFYEGLKLVPVFIGLFALPEVIDLAVNPSPIAKIDRSAVRTADVLEGIKDVFRHWWLTLRCSAIATGIGIIPGVGGAVAQWICYGHAKQTSKRAEEYGHGCEEGVIAVEAGNNAKEGGALLTTLAFGIPGSAAMVIILGALMMLGISPGPEIMSKHLDLLWTIVITLVVANVIAAGLCIAAAKDLARLTFIKGTILVPLILLLVILGAYGVANNIWDVLLAFVFGGIGYLLKVFDYSRVTLTIGYVLGDYLERYFLISTASLGPGFLLVSPVASVLLLLTILGMASGTLKGLPGRLLGRLRER